MDLSRREFVIASAAALLLRSGAEAPPAPYGALPSERQLKWHDLETYAFLHFGMNTFTDKEWGYGDEDPSLFNPTRFDPDAIVRDLKAGGMKAVILTCKHHDGFCLWPTQTTEHCIRNSRWRDGHGDVVRDISNAAQRAGLKFGVYVSPWDRSNATYGTPAYLPLYREQVRELLTRYGPIFEVWFDGANGGDGYYGGAREKRTISADYYQWDKIVKMIRQLQPEAVIFGEAGDVRWVGNESGIAGDPCWDTFAPQMQYIQNDPHASEDGSLRTLQNGVRDGSMWKPAECDVSIRPGWFWHAKENSQVKSPWDLLTLYYESVGRGASFLLNVPPDRQGLIFETDQHSLQRFGQLVQSTFARDLASQATLTASNVRGHDAAYAPANLIDGRRETYWSTDDSVTTPELLLTFKKEIKFNLVRLRENITLGQRVSEFAVDQWVDGVWRSFGKGTSIGSCRILRSDAPVTATRVRLRVTKAPVCPALSEIGLYLEA